MSDAPKCPLREDCDLTAAYMAGHERGKDALRNRIAALEAKNARLRETLKRMAEGWSNAIEFDLIPPQHVTSAAILRDEARAALEGKQ